MQNNSWKKYLIIIIVSLIVLGGIGYFSYDYGVKKVTEEFNKIERDSTAQIRLDSMFNAMLMKIDSSAQNRNTIYSNTEKIYNKIIKTYEKADTLTIYDNRDSLLQSLTRTSNTEPN